MIIKKASIFVIFILNKNVEMIKIDKDKVQVRYITGINKCLPNYPTPLDILYDSCLESVDDNLFSQAKIQNKYGIDEDKSLEIINTLLGLGYIEKNNSRFKIVKTIWD